MSKELKDFSQKQLGQIALDLVRGLVSRDRIMNDSQLAESDICLLESLTDEASQIIEAANNELCDLPIFADAQLLWI